jgi:uncharacterized damage-inducible protein DinB
MPTLLSHFQRLLAYDIWATAKTLEALDTISESHRTGPDYDRLMGLTPHNLTALRIWHWRITGQPYENPKDWFPKLTTAETAALATSVHAQWTTYLATLTDPDLSKEFDYKTSDGTPRHGNVADAITHVFNHATYHRGQIARITHQLGGTRPSTDFFLFTVSTT